MTQTSPSTGLVTPRFGGLYRSLFVNVVLPLIAVQVLLRNGVAPVPALAIAAVFPFAEAVFSLARSRRFDPIALLSLAAIVVGVGTSGVSGNPAFAVAKESVFTGVFGAVFLGSLLARRPIIFQLARQYSTGTDPASLAAWDARWANPKFRRVMRLITVAWGAGLLLEAVLRVAVAFTLPVATSTIVSPALQIAAIGALILWTTAYIRALRRRIAAAAARAA